MAVHFGESTTGTACFIDVETTGLSPYRHEVVELACVLFTFNRSSGDVLEIVDECIQLREPQGPIPSEATRIHGITDRMVKGHRLDRDQVVGLLEQAEFIVAHNADFDRGFVQRLLPESQRCVWCCSMKDVDWYGTGFRSRGLQNLLRDHGVVPDAAHRAAADCRAALELLACCGPSGKPYFSQVLAAAQVRLEAAAGSGG